VFAHVPDINGFVRGIAAILKVDGVAVIEFPYLVDLINGLKLDTINHERFFYFSLTPLITLFAIMVCTLSKLNTCREDR
jgi:hypothetical protein